MMHKLPKNLPVRLLLVAMLLVPVFAHAQATTLTRQMVLDVRRDETIVANIMNGTTPSTGNSVASSPEYQAALANLTTSCAAVGESLSSLSQGLWGAQVEMGRCAYGYFQPDPNGIPLFTGTNASVNAYIIGLGEGRVPDLTQAEFNRLVSQNSGSTALSEIWSGVQRYVLNPIIVGLGNLIASVLAFFATAALSLLDVVVNFATNPTNTPEIVSRTWVIVRDFMNMVFILALIVMSLGTILQNEKYNYKKLIFRLILMALLINFSKVIADTLIGVSDSLMLMFNVNGGIRQYGVTVFQGFIFGDGGFTGGVREFFGTNENTLAGLANVLAKIVSLIFLTVSIVAISMLMFVRMIGLWFLVMLSPVAYALRILPDTQKYSTQWWDTFTKYLIWGPVAMFFVRVSFVFITDSSTQMQYNGPDWIRFVIIGGLMWAAFLVSKQAGMYGASMITSAADKYARQGGRYAATAYGNMFWRGTYPGALAGAAGWAANKAGNKLPENVRNSLGINAETGTKWGENVKGKVGAFTARIQNEPGLQKQKWIDDPNKAREKVIKTERRRSEIRRDFLSDYDEDTAKKFSPQDFAYALSLNKLNGDKYMNLLEHGPEATKQAILAALSKGLIKVDPKTMPEQTHRMVHDEIRKYAWKKMGRAADDLPSRPDFMPYGQPDVISEQVVIMDKNGKLAGSKTFSEQLKNGYVKIDPELKFRKGKKARRNEQGAAAQQSGGGAQPPPAAPPGVQPPSNSAFTP